MRVRISMEGKGRFLDNVFVERLRRTVWNEDIFIRDHETQSAARIGPRTHFPFYNDERFHDAQPCFAGFYLLTYECRHDPVDKRHL